MVCNTQWIFKMHGAKIKINAHVTYVCICWFYYIRLSIGYSFFISHLFRFLIHLQWRIWFSKHTFWFITGVVHAPSNRKHIYSPVTISYNVSFQTVVYNTLCPRFSCSSEKTCYIRLSCHPYSQRQLPQSWFPCCNWFSVSNMLSNKGLLLLLLLRARQLKLRKRLSHEAYCANLTKVTTYTENTNVAQWERCVHPSTNASYSKVRWLITDVDEIWWCEVSTKSRWSNFVLVHIEISGSHSLECSAYGCLVCDTIKFGR